MSFSHSLLALLVLPALALADPKPALRIIRDQCVSCHKPGKAKGGLLLTSAEKMLKGGDNGAALVPGKAGESLLIDVLQPDADPHMPPKKQLQPAEIDLLKTWINEGAAWDAAVFDEPPPARQVKLAALPASYQPVLALALSPDDKRLAMARGGSILLIDLAAKERPVLGRLDGHAEPVLSLVWSKDGKWLVSGGHQRIMLWDAIAMQKSREMKAPLIGGITALALDGAGKMLFAADGEAGGAGFIHQFDLTQQDQRVATWKAHDDTVNALRLSPNGDRLLSGGADKMARLWSTTDRKLIGAFEGHTNHIMAVAFNHDASEIATAGADREVKVWNVATREKQITLSDRKSSFAALAWSPDGKKLAAITDKGGGAVYSDLKKHEGTERSDAGSERRLASVSDTLTSAVITADAKWVIAGGFSGKAFLWDGASGKAVGEIAPPP